MSGERIGVIGAGAIGSQLAQRFASLGYAVSVYDQDQTSARRLARFGAAHVQVPADVAEDASAVILSLPNERAVDDAVFDCGGLSETLPDGRAVVNLSKTSGDYGARASKQLRSLGLIWLEAALIGSPVGVGRWSLCLAAGAHDADLGRFEQHLLSRLAGQVAMLDTADSMHTVARIRMATALQAPSSAPHAA